MKSKEKCKCSLPYWLNEMQRNALHLLRGWKWYLNCYNFCCIPVVIVKKKEIV